MLRDERIAVLLGDEFARLLELGEADEHRVAMLGLVEGQLTIEGVTRAELAEGAAAGRCEQTDERDEQERARRVRGTWRSSRT